MLIKVLISIYLSTTILVAWAEPPKPGNWQLVFSDDFNSFDTSIWNPGLPGGNFFLGKTKAALLETNVNIEAGNLVLVSRKEKLKLTDKRGKTRKTKFTSGYVDSFNKFTQRYGYFEVRMKMPKTKGLHASFWLMPDRGLQVGQIDSIRFRRSTRNENGSNLGYTGQGMEIDVMEHLSRWKPNKFHLASHWNGFDKDMESFSHDYHLSSIDKNGYVKFGLLWKPKLLIWYANDVEVARQESDQIANVPMSMIFSTTMGGWGGRIKAKGLPDYTYIDYVKVWSDLDILE